MDKVYILFTQHTSIGIINTYSRYIIQHNEYVYTDVTSKFTSMMGQTQHSTFLQHPSRYIIQHNEYVYTDVTPVAFHAQLLIYKNLIYNFLINDVNRKQHTVSVRFILHSCFVILFYCNIWGDDFKPIAAELEIFIVKYEIRIYSVYMWFIFIPYICIMIKKTLSIKGGKKC